MECIHRDNESEIWFQLLERPYDFYSPFGGEDYVCLLGINDQHVTDDERHTLSAALVKTGCRYACCIGFDCSQWDTSIDIAYLETDKDYDPSEERFVMTTWHEDEPMEDTVNFFLNCTQFDDYVFSKRIIMFIGQNEEKKQEIRDLIIANKEGRREYLEDRERA
jgi:hypothetical protein